MPKNNLHQMFTLICILISAIVSTDGKICSRLKEFGNTVENKAYLAPIVILGNATLKIPVGPGLYRATIKIKKILKGTNYQWKNTGLVAGVYHNDNDSNPSDICKFKAILNYEHIHFLSVVNFGAAEFDVESDSIPNTPENLQIVNSIVCPGCSGVPRLSVKEVQRSPSNALYNCIDSGKPKSTVDWKRLDSTELPSSKPIQNGSQLILQRSVLDKDGYYECRAQNIAGKSSSYLIYQGKPAPESDTVTRWADGDSSFCRGKGKSYKDGSSIFCRCDSGYYGNDCSSSKTSSGQKSNLRRLSELDGKVCFNNGDAFANDKKIICVCKANYTGKRCEIFGQSTTREQAEMRKMMKEILNKATVKHTVIGALLVVAGCVFILLIIVCIWRCYVHKLRSEDEMDTDILENDRIKVSQRAPTLERNHETLNMAPRAPVPPKHQQNYSIPPVGYNDSQHRYSDEFNNLVMPSIDSEKL